MSEETKYHVVQLANGKSIIYFTDMFGARWNNPMYLEPRRGNDGQTHLHFLPFCEYGEQDHCDPIASCHVLVKYTPAPDVVRIYKLFLADFAKAREQARAARAASATATAGNVTPLGTANLGK